MLPRYLNQYLSPKSGEKEQEKTIYIPTAAQQQQQPVGIARSSTGKKSPPRSQPKIDDSEWGIESEEDDLSKAIKANNIEEVKKLVSSGVKVEPYHLFFEGKRSPESIRILAYLVDKTDIDTLLEVGWSGDNHFKLWAMGKILKEGTPQQKKELFDAAYDYAEVAVFFGNNHFVAQIVPYINKPSERRNLIELAIKNGKSATLIALLKGMKVDLYEYLADEIPKENEDASDEYPLKLAVLKQLLANSEYEPIIDKLIVGLDEYYFKLRRKINSWYTHNELAVNLHIDPNCVTGQAGSGISKDAPLCSVQLNKAYDDIEKSTLESKDKNSFLNSKLKAAREAKDKLGLIFLNDSDLSGNDMEEFYQPVVVFVPKKGTKDSKDSKDSKEIYWFSPIDFSFILEKKQNPYTNEKLDESVLMMIREKIDQLKRYNVDYTKILGITDTMKILTDHKTYPYLPGQVERLIAAETVEEQLAKLVGGYYSADVYQNIRDDEKSLSPLVYLINNTLSLHINKPYDRKKILNTLLNYILIDKESRAAAVLTIFNDYFALQN